VPQLDATESLLLLWVGYLMGHIEYDSFKTGFNAVVFWGGLDEEDNEIAAGRLAPLRQARATWRPTRYSAGVDLLHTEGLNVTSFMGGAEYRLTRLMPNSNIRWFAGGQAGIQRWFGQTDFALQPAVSAEWALNEAILGRGSVGVRMIFGDGSTAGIVGAFGIVVPFGR
jgi:hypothetical protein